MNLPTPAKQKRLPVLFLILSAVTAIAYFLAVKLDFEEDIGHFAYGSAAFIICAASIAVSVVLSVIISLGSKKYAITAAPVNSSFYTFASCFAAALSLAVFVTGLSDAQLSFLTSTGSRLSFSALDIKSKLMILETLATPFIAVSFIMSLLEKTRVSSLRAVMTTLAALSINVSMFVCYFDSSLPLNSPVKYIITIAESCLLLFLLSEARLAFAKSENRASYAFSVLASALTASTSLGISAGMVLSKLFSPLSVDPNLPFLTSAMYLAISLCAAARLISLTKGAEPKESDKENNKD